MNIRLIACILAFLPAPLFSQADPDHSGSHLILRLATVGHKRPAEFILSKEDQTIEVPSLDGKSMERQVIPAGSPREIRGGEWEYLPLRFFLNTKSKEEKKELVLQPTLNAVSSPQKIAPSNVLELKTVSGSETPYIRAQLPQNATHVLMVLAANSSTKEMWKTPQVSVFDTSSKTLPPGSLFFYNSTPFAIELDVPVEGKKEVVIVESQKTATVRPGVNAKGRTKAIVRLVSRNGNVKKQFYHNTLPIPKNGRTYLIAYFQPDPKSPFPAGIVQFNDTL